MIAMRQGFDPEFGHPRRRRRRRIPSRRPPTTCGGRASRTTGRWLDVLRIEGGRRGDHVIRLPGLFSALGLLPTL